jgi:hypothetical protein
MTLSFTKIILLLSSFTLLNLNGSRATAQESEGSYTSVSSFLSGQYVISGYRKQAVYSGNQIELKAKMTKGFPAGEFEQMKSPEFTLHSGPVTLKISGDKGIFKEDEGIFESNVTAIMDIKKDISKSLFIFKKNTKSVHMQITLSDFVIRASDSEIDINQDHYVGGAVNINLPRREIFWPSGVEKNKTKLLGPITVPF